MVQMLKVPQLAWYGSRELELPLADGWQVEMGCMAGHDRLALTSDQIRDAVTGNLIGSPPLRELARGKKDVVIIFDDMTRVTRVAEIVPFVLEELAAAGIPDDRIRFIAALGCHGAMNRFDFAKKLGEEILARFPVYNHNPYASSTYVGRTAAYGTEVYINQEVMKCDLKIAIGSVVPHPRTGFGGGGKIMLPGVAAFETIEHNHRMFLKTFHEQGPKVIGMGVFDPNPARVDIEEAATLAGLDVMINCMVNTWGETVAIFAGALKPAYAAAIEAAKAHYLTPAVKGKDIVIANTFAKANEAWIALAVACTGLKPEGGDIVLIGNTPEGQVTHYLLGPFGRTVRGPLGKERKLPSQVNRLLVYSEYPDLASRAWFGAADRTSFLHRWDEVLRVLDQRHTNGAEVVVYPNAEIQYQ
jgi:nickel-dependent lactate racemase